MSKNFLFGLIFLIELKMKMIIRHSSSVLFMVMKTNNFKKIDSVLSEFFIVISGKFRRSSVRNLDVSIRFSLKSRPSEGFPRPEMSQMKAEISLHANLKLIFHKNVGWQGYQWIP